MPATKMLDQRELRLAREAAEWRLISMFFECPDDAWRAQLAGLAAEVDDPELKSVAGHAQQEATEGTFHYVFGPGGPAPAREASYQNTVELGYLMSELQTYYNAFAFTPATAEPPDHVSVETAFIAYLKLKECYALACGDEERASIAREAADNFMKDHLATVARPLAGHLQNSDVPYLCKAGAVLAQRVPQSAKPQSVLPVLQESDAESCMTCGGGPVET
jgi:nitrate reductase assembly molybdenum cofactor insertion protein NarJ